MLKWDLLVLFLLRWLLLSARSNVALSHGWFPLLLPTRFPFLASVCWPKAVALRHAFRPWVAESWGVGRSAPRDQQPLLEESPMMPG